MRNSKFSFAGASAGLAVLIALVAAALPAHAAAPVFPFGSRVGLVPPPGMVASDSFTGFADPQRNAAILITTMPAAAYAHIEKSLNREALDRQGLVVEKREPMNLAVGKGFLIVGRQTADKHHYRKWLLVVGASELTALVSVQVPEDDSAYSDSALRTSLSTLAVRATVPQAEELKLLPFTIGNFAGFQVAAVLPGRAIIIGDLPAMEEKDAAAAGQKPAAPSKEAKAGEPAKDVAAAAAKPPAQNPAQEPAKAAAKPARQDAREPAPVTVHMMIAAIPGGPSEFDDRANFARLNFNEIGGINGIHDTMSEPMRIGGQPGFQTEAQAKDEKSGADVTVLQWLRFGNGGFLQMTAIAPTADWTTTLERLRTVRDSIEAR